MNAQWITYKNPFTELTDLTDREQNNSDEENINREFGVKFYVQIKEDKWLYLQQKHLNIY